MPRKTVFKKIEIGSDGVITVWLQKQLVDGDQVHNLGWHIVVVEPGIDPAFVLTAVNTNLTEMGQGIIGDDDWSKVSTAVAAYHTPAVVAAYRAAQAAQAEGEIDA